MSKIKIDNLDFCETESTEDCNIVGGYNYYDDWSVAFFNNEKDDLDSGFFTDSYSLEAPKSDVKSLTVSDTSNDSNGKVFASVTKGRMNGREFARSTSSARI